VPPIGSDNYPRGEPRRRLRAKPLPCPISGKLMVGEECLRSGCPWASEAEGFVDCELTGARSRPGTFGQGVGRLAL